VPNAQHVPAALEAIILKCLSKRQDQRYQNMDEVVADLDRLEAGEVPDAMSDLENRTEEFSVPDDYFQSSATSLDSAPVVTQRRHNWLMYTGVAGLLAAVAIVSAIVAQSARTDSSSRRRAKTVGTVDQQPSLPAPSSPKPNEPTVRPAAETTVRQVVLATEPLDALVYLDGKNIGSSPVVVDVVEGQQAKLEIRRSGYKTKEVSVDGTEGRLSVRLEKTGAVRPPPRATGSKSKGAAPTDLGDPWAKR
jgi:serine/threonine-protein kinase